MRNERIGCLFALFKWLVTPAGPGEKSVPVMFDPGQIEETVESGPLPYRRRDDFLSPAEGSFYRVLSSAVRQRYVVCPKVRLADVVFVAESGNWAAHNRINQRHLDFLLCEAASLRPVLAVELDDSTHLRPDRQKADEFMQEVLAAADLPLLRIPAQYSYSPTELAWRVSQALAVPTEQSPAPAAPQLDGVPRCPKCNIPMVERIATRGDYRGQRFYGCINYPRCQEIMAV